MGVSSTRCRCRARAATLTPMLMYPHTDAGATLRLTQTWPVTDPGPDTEHTGADPDTCDSDTCDPDTCDPDTDPDSDTNSESSADTTLWLDQALSAFS